MNYEIFPIEIEETEYICALRFDGYLYIEQTNQEFPILNRPIVDARRMYEDSLKNFAVFFALQRYLHKWGGDSLTKYSPEHHAYDLLYLHLYQTETPEAYANSEYVERWNAIDPEKREDVAQHIRESLSRKGTGRISFYEDPNCNLEP